MEAEIKIRSLIKTQIKPKQVELGKYTINYVEAGDGPILILLHGANIGWGQWHPNLDELSKNFKVVALDLPGSGLSTKVDFRTLDLEKDMVDIVREFIRYHKWDEVRIVGHSLGGWVGLKLALKDPGLVKKLVLVNSLGIATKIPVKYRLLSIYSVARLLSRTVMKPTRVNMKKFLAEGMYNTNELKEEFVDYFYESIHSDGLSHPFMLISRLSGLFKMQEELVLIDDLANIKIPVLVIVGDRDPLNPVEQHRESAALMPNSMFEVFAETKHVPSMEKAGDFNSKVLSFLSS